MSPDLIGVLAAAFCFALAAAIYRLPVGTCSECPHCERIRRERRNTNGQCDCPHDQRK